MMCPILDASGAAIEQAADALAGGALVILPTDTVYGITADIRSDEAVTRLSAAKGRGNMPLQLLFPPDPDMIARYVTIDARSRQLVERFAPGGWTLILPAQAAWASPALAGGRTVGVRVPDAPVVHRVTGRLRAPLAASSANRHGDPSPTRVADAVASIGDACALAIDGGPMTHGLDSTIIDLTVTPPVILREGAIDRATVADILEQATIEVRRSIRPATLPGDPQ